MSNYPQLDEAISNLKKNGMSDEEIKNKLLNAGWSELDIINSYRTLFRDKAVSPNIPSAPAKEELPIIKNENVNPQVVNDSLNNPIPKINTMPQNAEAVVEQVKVTPNISNTPEPTNEPTNIPIAQNTPVINSSPQPELQAPKTKSKKSFIVFLIIFILLIVAAGIYFFVINPITFAKYNEGNLSSEMVKKLSEIKSSKNTISLKIYAKDRDEGAKSYESVFPSNSELQEKYARDYQRIESVSNIVSLMDNYLVRFNKYPASLQELENAIENGQVSTYFEYQKYLRDPLTNEYLQYRAINNSQDFNLSINFETNEMISALSDRLGNETYQERNDVYVIQDKTVTFGKFNYYIFVSPELPKSMYETLSSLAEYLSPEFDVTGSIITQFESQEGDVVPEDFYLGVKGNGDLGDMTYKIDLEFQKVSEDFFLKINNLPSIFLSYLGPIEKGKWIKDDLSESGNSFFLNPADLETQLNESESQFKEVFKTAVRIADEEKLFTFKNKPKLEVVNERKLYKYNLDISPEKFKVFYEKFYKEIESNQDLKELLSLEYKEILDSLSQDDFNQKFNFYRENINFSIWTDKEGYPAIIEISLRLIPKDEISTFKNKQLMIDARIEFDEINTPFDLVAPEDYDSMKELMGSVEY